MPKAIDDLVAWMKALADSQIGSVAMISFYK